VSIALAALVMPRRRSVVSRIDSFTPSEATFVEVAGERAPVAALVVADRRLERFQPWTAFKLDVELAGIGMPAIRIALMVVATAAGLAFLLGGPVGSPPAAVVVALVLPVTARMLISARAGRVRRRFADQLAENLQVLASALRAGHSFLGALSVMVNDASEPSRSEYQRVLAQEQFGVPIEESLNVVSERMRNDDVSYIGLIATLQQETGGNTAEVLDRVVNTIRERAELRRLVRTLTAQGRLGGWIVTGLPLALILLLSLVNPGYLDPMLDNTLGQVILAVAFMMVGAGALIIRRIVDIEV
jgi:tight adherence protein B